MVETGYRQLIVLRHAKTEQSASSDRARVLTSRGRRDARTAGGWLRENDLAPDVVLTSPAARASETAEIVCRELASPPRVVVVDELYGASVDEAMAVVTTVGNSARRVLLVGHNPTMADLVHELQRETDQPWASHLPTSGIAVLEVPGGWADLKPQSARLTQGYVPRD